MNALNLHHAIFTNEKASDLPLRSASSFLHPAPERDESPTSQLFVSAAYQDLIQRQPTHPNGPMSGWDLGLNLLGDPVTAEEYKNLKDYQTKMKLRRLHAVNIAFELLFGIWGTYITIRYFLAFADSSDRLYAAILGIVSALLVALVIISVMMPLFPQRSHLSAWRHTRLLFRSCYLLLLCAGPVANVVLVLVWHPRQLCGWDIDISWYTSSANTSTSPCRPVPFGAWIAAAIVRLIVTWAIVLLFVYTLRLYHETRHPSGRSSPKYSAYFSSEPEEISPTSPSSPLKSKLANSSRMLNRSNTTLPKYTSISTLAASTSCIGHSRSHSTSPPNDIKISPSSSRGTPTHVIRSETPSQTQPGNAVTELSHMLRHKSRVPLARMTSVTTLSGTEKSDGPASSPSESRSSASLHRPLDLRKTSSAWESAHTRHASQTSVSSTSSPTHEWQDTYGYGVPAPAYPYLDMYNPNGDTASEDAPEPVPEPSPPSSAAEESSEDEYVAMMGGFVRRMATIESLGSREAGTATVHTLSSHAPGSQYSSVRFGGSSGSASPKSLSTAYLSFVGTGRVNERGEIVTGNNSAASSSYDRQYCTATSGSSYPIDDER